MCMCGKPTVNGEPGYSWDGKTFMVRQPAPPDLADGDKLLHDEPGRCGGLDSHCHHFRLVKEDGGAFCLLVRHGGGDERVRLGRSPGMEAFNVLDSNGRYWLMQMIYCTQSDAADKAREREHGKWVKAAAEKRIKTRKCKSSVKVWIESGVSQ